VRVDLNLGEPVRRLVRQVADLLRELPCPARQMLRTAGCVFNAADDPIDLGSHLTNLAFRKFHLAQIKREHLPQCIKRLAA